MDAGRIDDTTSLTHYNVERVPGFFTNKGAVTLLGSWGEGVVAWSNAQYAPYRAKPLQPVRNTQQAASKPSEFEPGTGCDADHFKESDFDPGWKWEKTQSGIDWAKPAVNDPVSQPDPTGGHGPFFRAPRWFTDIDGDGLIDRLADTGIRVFDFNVAYVEFTRRYGKNDPRPIPGSGPVQIPFAFDPSAFTGESLAPSAEARSDTKFYYVDINGDGLVDLVTQNPNDSGGIPRVRPGDGHGHFWCDNSQQPWPCQEWPAEPSSGYEIVSTGSNLPWPGSRMPWPFTDETFFHDVTGDGLADIVQYDMSSGEVRVWVNQDGHTFAYATASCDAAGIVQDHRTATRNIGEHRTTFADMNADGIDDIVILAKQGAYVGLFMTKYLPVFERGAPRPGLLTRIHNGYGATTDIRYRTIQSLDLEAKDSPLAWQYHSPVAESVVTQIITQDSYHAGGNLNDAQISAPYLFKRVAQYFYQNPAYDRWSRSFAGFRKVFTHYGDELATTATTYWFGPCQNNDLAAWSPKARATPFCQEGSDDDDYKSLTGRVVRIDRGNDLLNSLYPERVGPKHLWTKIFHYTRNSALFDRPDRRVSFSYPSQIDTYLYYETKPTKPGEEIPPIIAGGDPLEEAPHQKNIRKHLSRSAEYDNRGSLKRVVDRGAVVDKGESNPADKPDAITFTLFSSLDAFDHDGPNNSIDPPPVLPCTSDWQCLPSYVSIWEPQPTRTGNDPDKLLRKSRFTYTLTGDVAAGDLKSVQGWLAVPSQSLERHHPMGDNKTALKPAGQALARGWHTRAILIYDAWGNVIQTISGQSPGGSPPSCIAIGYDEPYQHLPNVVRNFKDGCGGSALETQTIFDRGFEQVVSSTAPNGSSSEIRFDPFGRPREIYLPNPDATPGSQAPVLAATVAYSDKKPVSHIDVRHIVGTGTSTRSVTILNGLGEPVVAFDQGDNNDWVLNGWRETNLAGNVEKVRRPWAFTGDPIAAAVNAKYIPVPSDNAFFEISYDGFGRKISVKENGAGFAQELMRNSYFPLALETRDAEQFKPGGPHEKAFQRVEFDGHGRSTRAIEHIHNPTTNNIVTTVTYIPTGEPDTITRTDNAGSTYQRKMVFDSLGRLMVNQEPNTGNNWRYVWDDAGRLVGTSDARGCGENFHYDGLGRLLGEDYSPCLASQPAYTAPNLATGEGLETFYRYDNYEADQVSPEPGFADDPKFALGNLVAVQDRGSHTRFNYDARDRVRRISRQIAKPEGFDSSSPYASHWFSSRRDYDMGDRLTRRTTGVDVPELLMNGGSEERYAYSPRGLPFSIDSSYGRLIEKTLYAPDGAPNSITYGDFYGTKATFEYDARRRLTRYDLTNSKSYPPLWLKHLTYFDYRFSSYDNVGNPLVIEDKSNGVINPISSAQLPPDAAPVQKRNMEYDDLYRLTGIDTTYKVPGGIAPWRSPFEPEISTHDRHPVPLRSLPTRVTQQTFDYDYLGNLTASSDDLKASYDRSLGPNLGYGAANNGPNQLQTGEGLQVRYDEAGNLSALKINRTGDCPTGIANQCAQWFAYDWDEVGQLARARRWDFDGNALPPQATKNALPAEKPSWDLTYAYSQGARVRKSATDAAGVARHTLEIFDTLRIQQAPFNATDGNYKVKRDNVHAYPGGMAHVFWDSEGQLPHQAPDSLITMNLIMGDHLGSSSVVINHANSGLAERTTYLPYGAVESDYRPTTFREPYKFTGKEEDIEVGATYFGARYYQPYLGRFMSADPLTIHGLGSDLNPYAYVGGRVMTHVDRFGLDETPAPDPGCLGKEKCDDIPQWQKDLEKTKAAPTTTVDEGTTVPTVPEPVRVTEKEPFDPGKDMNFIDRWIWGGSGGFHDVVTSDRNLATLQTGLTAVTIVAATIATGGLALEAAGLTVEGIGATAFIHAGRAAQVFTQLSLAEQGIVGVGAGGAVLGVAEEGALLFSSRYAGRVGPGRFATSAGRLPANGAGYASDSIRKRIAAFFKLYGCHTCGTKIGQSIADHQPPNAFNLKGLFRQWFYPQCVGCSPRQGNEVKELLKP
jgi:RHS repeat-associated protein